MLKLNNIEIKGAILAPMAGYTDVGLRDMAARYGAGMTVTEMVSAKGLVYGNEKTKELLAVTENERVRAVQLFGSEPEFIERAVKMPDLDKFQVIDINMGCPVPKIVKNGEGSALLNNPRLAAELVRAAVEASGGRPVTVKTRLGFDEGETTCKELIAAVASAGAAAVTLHGRTRIQFYSGKADYDRIREAVLVSPIPIIVNGDINSAEDARRVTEFTGASAAAIGRGALGNPKIFRDIYSNEFQDREFPEMSAEEEILEEIATLKRFYEDKYIYSNMKKIVCAYLKSVAGVREMKNRICRAESLSELLAAIDEAKGVYIDA